MVDGGKKTVEFSFVGLLKNTLRYTFRSRDLHALFDRQWHKLSISVQSNIVSIYMDCKLVERRLTDERDGLDPSGRTLITTRVEDGRPVDVRPVQPKLDLISSNLNTLEGRIFLMCLNPLLCYALTHISGQLPKHINTIVSAMQFSTNAD